LELSFDIGQLAFSARFDVAAACRRIHPQGKEFRNLLERKPQSLGTPDELEVGDISRRILAVAGGTPRWFRQEPPAFVIPHGLDVHPCSYG
jgi:hypothetical protein